MSSEGPKRRGSGGEGGEDGNSSSRGGGGGVGGGGGGGNVAGRGLGRRRKRARTGLRPHQPLSNCTVEAIFPLYKGSNASSSTVSLLSAAVANNNEDNNKDNVDNKAGDGLYISAVTTNNQRFYGVAISQPALKEASARYFQSERQSRQLTERMQLLWHTREQEQKQYQKLQQEEVEEEDPNMKPATVASIRNHHQSSASESELDLDLAPACKKVTGNGHQSELEDRSRDEQVDLGTKKVPLNHHQSYEPCATPPSAMPVTTASSSSSEDRSVQKFKFVTDEEEAAVNDSNGNYHCRRHHHIWVATFCNVTEAANGDATKAQAIRTACEMGGNFLATAPPDSDSYYYQYQDLPSSLVTATTTTTPAAGMPASSSAAAAAIVRNSMDFNKFLQDTVLPPWYPLASLNFKGEARSAGATVPLSSCGDAPASILNGGGTMVPMRPREKKQYQIGIIGGGIAGLACAQELVTMLEKDGINVKVTLMEARLRLGGRLWTDRSFRSEPEEQPLNLELGASWIHGIQNNPLATLAESAGVEFLTTSEEVTLLGRGMREVDRAMDAEMGTLFDQLLDHASEDCWSNDITEERNMDAQASVRWYARCSTTDSDGQAGTVKPVDTPAHRRSGDRSVDVELGRAVANHQLHRFSKLSPEEHRLLVFHTKNVEYALGANIDDLSMRYWDIDDQHAFEGNHVLLRQGYSTVVDHVVTSLEKMGADKFEYHLNFEVGKVQYAIKSTSEAYEQDRGRRARRLVELSDACSVESEDGEKRMLFDFVVCAVPLGVLKESVERATTMKLPAKSLSFQPPLPFSKVDAISNVGFGLLNKIYVRFTNSFWRIPGVFKDDNDFSFGNVSGVHPHHYMFFDVGRRLGTQDNAPPVLMSLVSGREAVAMECLTDKEVVEQFTGALRAIFSSIKDISPVEWRVTRWGEDRFSRGSYTFLGPGTTDEDFRLLQSPINGSGDSATTDGAGTMRLFFAGEHTTAQHPSMAHGAMLSGMRAAQEIVATIKSQSISVDNALFDRAIPLALFRHWNPKAELKCGLCGKIGEQTQEGSLLAFRRGAREVVVHSNCAEFCPEVEITENSQWKYIVRAVTRGRRLACDQCSMPGATIGCLEKACTRVFHFSCAEGTGWRFEKDGKEFFCDLHRTFSAPRLAECNRISIHHYLQKMPSLGRSSSAPICSLCHKPDNPQRFGSMLAFQQRQLMRCVHDNCIRNTSIIDTSEVKESSVGKEYHNVISAVDMAATRKCSNCQNAGASIACQHAGCDAVLHYPCGVVSNASFETRGKSLRCNVHKNSNGQFNKDQFGAEILKGGEIAGAGTGSIPKVALFSAYTATLVNDNGSK